MNEQRPADHLRLRLFVAGHAPNSEQARANLRSILRSAAVSDAEVEIIDCLADPLRAMEEGVFVTPTLLKLAPAPRESVVGPLGNEDRVLQALNLQRAVTLVPGDQRG